MLEYFRSYSTVALNVRYIVIRFALRQYLPITYDINSKNGMQNNLLQRTSCRECR